MSLCLCVCVCVGFVVILFGSIEIAHNVSTNNSAKKKQDINGSTELERTNQTERILLAFIFIAVIMCWHNFNDIFKMF